MPYIQSDGARLYYETAGTGTPIVFVHEFSGDLWSWEKQIQHFSRRYRCIAFNARGYPPSDVPTSLTRYSHKLAVDDVAVVMRHLKVSRAHVIGCSMGARTTLDFGLRYPRMALSLSMVGIGSGGDPRNGASFKRDAEARARLYEEGGLAEVLKGLRKADNRIALEHKNPRAFDDFCRRFMQHSAQGCANITRRVMARRPSLFSMEKALRAMKTPAHVIVGDEDPGAIRSGLFMKQVAPAVRLSVIPATGHLVNLEEPDLMHRLTEDFLALVESKKWRPRHSGGRT
jgi:pimeloyl-ACP methyl ester carboxylesterase